MNIVQSIELQKYRQHNGYYKRSDIPNIARLFKAEIFENPVRRSEPLPPNHIAIFPRSHNQSFQVFIHTVSESFEITAV
jgi:hypothetical protein